jgi:hypothetical protein
MPVAKLWGTIKSGEHRSGILINISSGGFNEKLLALFIVPMRKKLVSFLPLCNHEHFLPVEVLKNWIACSELRNVIYLLLI